MNTSLQQPTLELRPSGYVPTERKAQNEGAAVLVETEIKWHAPKFEQLQKGIYSFTEMIHEGNLIHVIMVEATK
jgi:hypothetical protein